MKKNLEQVVSPMPLENQSPLSLNVEDSVNSKLTWKLTSDEAHNTALRQEFSFEHAPSVPLCLAILKLHSEHVAYPRLVVVLVMVVVLIILIIIIVIKKEAKKILKYKDLTIEIQHMWNVKTKVIPVITGATGTLSKSFRKYVSNIPGKHEAKELQKTGILGTAHILRKVLM